MPILNDIMDHEVFGPEIRRGMELGRQEGFRSEVTPQDVIVNSSSPP